MLQIDVQNIDHPSIVAGIVDDIGILEIIDQELGRHPQEKVSVVQVVKAMILNYMDFLTAPLYLFSDFLRKSDRTSNRSRSKRRISKRKPTGKSNESSV